MLKYLAKISMDIFPSVLATIIGAYIVNHYINAKPAPDAPAAAVAPLKGKNGKPADVANLPAPGVKARGISEKAVMDKPAAEKPAEQPVEAKATDVAPVETAPHGRPASREKAIAKSTPATAPTVEASSAPAAGTTAAAPDANDLVRAAVERLRKSPETRSAETKSSETKSSETKFSETKSSEAKSSEIRSSETKSAEKSPEPVAQETAVRPLPPPITVSTPATDAANPPYTASVGNDDQNRLTPPADIPVPVIAPPLDLRADAGASMPRPRANVADDMLSGVRSMFHAVLPKSAIPSATPD
jgi:hypothetical protein